MTNAEVDAVAKLLSWEVAIKKDPTTHGNWVYVIEHEKQAIFVNWGHRSRLTAIGLGAKHLREVVLQTLGENHGI